MPVPQDDPMRCGLSWAAKVCASGAVHTGREPARTFGESCNWMAASDEVVRMAIDDGDAGPLLSLRPEIELDAVDERWTLHLDGVTAHAKRFGDQGVAVVADADEEAHFTPTHVPRDATPGVHTPLDVPDVAPEPGATGADVGLLRDAEEVAFARPEQMTNALLVLHRGELLVERYREPFDADTRFESWSMGKTIASTLFGVAAQQGLVDLDDALLFDE